MFVKFGEDEIDSSLDKFELSVPGSPQFVPQFKIDLKQVNEESRGPLFDQNPQSILYGTSTSFVN